MVGSVYSSISRLLSRRLSEISKSMSDSLERISTGQRILRPSDDPASFSMLTKLESQLRGLREASLNINQVQGITTTADIALGSLYDIVLELKDLALQAADGNLSADDRMLLAGEASGLLSEFNYIAQSTNFGGRNLLDGSFNDFYVQTGAKAGNGFSFSIGDARASALGKIAIYSGAQGSLLSKIGGSSATVLSINGVSIGASVSDGVSTSGENYSAIAIANAINAYQNKTDVTAEALATQRTLYIDDFSSSSGVFSGSDFKINDVSIMGSITEVGELVDAINDQSSFTGVVASLDTNGNVLLVAKDGRNIEISISNSSGNDVFEIFNITQNQSFFAADVSLLSDGASTTHTGAIQLYSSKAIVISGGASVSQTIGLTAGVKHIVNGTSVSSINLSTEEGADLAIKILDATLEDISRLRAEVGAVHGRLDFSLAYVLKSQLVIEGVQENIGGVDTTLELANITMQQLLQDSTLAAIMQANVSYSAAARLLTEGLSS